MSATLAFTCPVWSVECSIPAVDVSVHLHPAGGKVEWLCLCGARHAQAHGRDGVAVLRAAGARVVRAGRAPTGPSRPDADEESWLAAMGSLLVAEAEALCLDAARSR